jgi:mono/diheme cytochrome c family protein
MRTFKHVLIRLASAALIFVFAAAAVVFLLSHRKLARHYAIVSAPVAVPNTAESIERGRHIATIRGCLSCHGNDLGGGLVMDNVAMGRVYGPNLTKGSGGVGGFMKNEDWVRAVREGVAADGHPLFIMPSKDLVALSDEDLGALLAYIDSAAPVARKVPAIAVGPVSRVLLALGKNRLSAEVIDHARAPAAMHVGIEVSPEYGRYLASTCTGCHNPSLSGGKISEGPPKWPAAANLTPGPGSAVAGWSEGDFIRVIRTAVAPDGRTVDPVMPRAFAQMSDVELKALWAYLRTLPPAPTGHAAAAGT